MYKFTIIKEAKSPGNVSHGLSWGYLYQKMSQNAEVEIEKGRRSEELFCDIA